MDSIISFPILGNLTLNPASTFSIFGLTFHWYGAIIALGFLLALWYAHYACRHVGMKFDDVIDFVLIAVPVSVVCARLYYVIFYFDLYRDDLISILYIWEGGLAFYGAVIGGLLSVLIFCRAKKHPAGPLLDVGCMGLLIGQSVGRWANFINREAYGTSANIDVWPLRMGLTDPVSGVTTYVHPTFLYESVWYALGFLLLHWMLKKGKRKYDGEICILYFIWNGLGRAVIEGLRTDSLYLFGTGIRVSQALAVLFVLAGVLLLVFFRVKFSKAPPILWVNRPVPAETAAAEAGEVPVPASAQDAGTDSGTPSDSGSEPGRS